MADIRDLERKIQHSIVGISNKVQSNKQCQRMTEWNSQATIVKELGEHEVLKTVLASERIG